MTVDADEAAELDGTQILKSALLPEALLPQGTTQGGRQQTAKKAIEILVAKCQKFHDPTACEREALAIAFAKRRKVVYGAAFDVVRLAREIDLSNADEIYANIEAVELIEVKSTNRRSINSRFEGYFFALTTAELLVAQSLGSHYKFAFVNTLTGNHTELSLQEVFARSRGIYPTWSIRF